MDSKLINKVLANQIQQYIKIVFLWASEIYLREAKLV